MARRFVAFLFLFLIATVLWQCARKGSPSGGPKDVTPPTLVKTEPEGMTTNFKAKRIRLYFDELIKLEDVQNQLIVSPPLKYQPDITPQGGASKYVEIKLKDTLRENTTYTLNFGQSVQDNNEGNPSAFLTYVFSTGDYIDSLQLTGAVRDAFNKKADDFISVMLYELDTAYTDSTIYKKPPNYITNTLDSAVIFRLKNLKEGKYKLFALKDAAKNNVFDQNADKIAFLQDTITLPTDSTYVLTLFKEVPNYSMAVPSFVAKNRIQFGYYGDASDVVIEPLTQLPDTVNTKILKERDKDTINFWFTPFEVDSIVFTVTNERFNVRDTFSVKSRKVGIDSLQLRPNQSGSLSFSDPFHIQANTPLTKIDTTKISMMDQDSLPVNYSAQLDTLLNHVSLDFPVEPNQSYQIDLLPGAITDFFGQVNDTTAYFLSTGSYADFGNLTFNINVDENAYPLIVQLTDEQGKVKREILATEPQAFEFNHLEPANYLVRVIFDANNNGKWDTGNYLKKLQPEKISYYPDIIEIRANWEKVETFTIRD
ncbi:Ig-like domain-containing protein [Pseudozobellia thermophila]|uniref:Ig-like domain-containing protein n=1 Tax=Pseudozobellia thermophila TaxID=192903 RepID=A0A1M6ASJ7_9FLAO|nr:Ig-like domain-containing protein [Pseudozobellia thermophila]SHI39440.1 Ig-like domain-containing protein [Pseudozobellia thermophila]